jgi:hypothetical protein
MTPLIRAIVAPKSSVNTGNQPVALAVASGMCSPPTARLYRYKFSFRLISQLHILLHSRSQLHPNTPISGQAHPAHLIESIQGHGLCLDLKTARVTGPLALPSSSYEIDSTLASGTR